MLSGPHQKFAEGIAFGLNQTEAYLAAYPDVTRETAAANGSALLRNTKITDEVARLRKEAEKQAGSAVLTLAEMYSYLSSVVRTPVGDVDETSELCQEYSDEVSEFGAKKKFKMPCKLRALELHAKLAGMLSDKVKLEGDATIHVTIGT